MSETGHRSDARLAEEVRRFVFDDASGAGPSPSPDALQAAGTRVHGPVLDLLADGAMQGRLAARPQGPYSDPPFVRACRLLGARPPTEAVAVLPPYLDHGDWDVRLRAAEVFGLIADSASLPTLRKLLAGPDRGGAFGAMRGLLTAAEGGWMDPAIVPEIFDAIRARFESDAEGKGCWGEPELLLQLDRGRAFEFLAAEPRWQAPSKRFPSVLVALADAGAFPSRERLVGLLGRAMPGGDRHGDRDLLQACFHMLGAMRDPGDLADLDRMLDDPRDGVARGARRGLLAAHGLWDFEERIDEERCSFRNHPESLYAAVEILDVAVLHDWGFIDYFVRPFSRHWRLALEGLEAMGLVQRAAIYREVLDLLREQLTRPGATDETWGEEIATRFWADPRPLSVLSRRWSECAESVLAKSTRFVVAHAEDFR